MKQLTTNTMEAPSENVMTLDEPKTEIECADALSIVMGFGKDKASFEAIEDLMLNYLPDSIKADTANTHHFLNGVYMREGTMPAGSMILGQKHRHKTFNIMLTGRMRLYMDGNVTELVAPCIFISEAGVQKLAHVIEDTRWLNVYATQETDLEKIEEELYIKSDVVKEWEKNNKPDLIK